MHIRQPPARLLDTYDRWWPREALAGSTDKTVEPHPATRPRSGTLGQPPGGGGRIDAPVLPEGEEPANVRVGAFGKLSPKKGVCSAYLP